MSLSVTFVLSFYGEMGNIFKICSSLWLWLRQNAIQNYCPYNDANWFLPKLSPNIQLLEISKSENLSHFSKDLASEGNWLAQSFWANWSGLAQGKFDISKTWILMSKTVVLCLTSCLGHWNLLDSWAWHQAKPDELALFTELLDCAILISEIDGALFFSDPVIFDLIGMIQSNWDLPFGKLITISTLVGGG